MIVKIPLAPAAAAHLAHAVNASTAANAQAQAVFAVLVAQLGVDPSAALRMVHDDGMSVEVPEETAVGT